MNPFDDAVGDPASTLSIPPVPKTPLALNPFDDLGLPVAVTPFNPFDDGDGLQPRQEVVHSTFDPFGVPQQSSLHMQTGLDTRSPSAPQPPVGVQHLPVPTTSSLLEFDPFAAPLPAAGTRSPGELPVSAAAQSVPFQSEVGAQRATTPLAQVALTATAGEDMDIFGTSSAAARSAPAASSARTSSTAAEPPPGHTAGMARRATDAEAWTCAHCTYCNRIDVFPCEVCGSDEIAIASPAGGVVSSVSESAAGFPPSSVKTPARPTHISAGFLDTPTPARSVSQSAAGSPTASISTLAVPVLLRVKAGKFFRKWIPAFMHISDSAVSIYESEAAFKQVMRGRPVLNLRPEKSPPLPQSLPLIVPVA